MGFAGADVSLAAASVLVASILASPPAAPPDDDGQVSVAPPHNDRPAERGEAPGEAEQLLPQGTRQRDAQLQQPQQLETPQPEPRQPAAQQQGAVVVEIRVRGNYSIPDDEIIADAGVAVGDRLQADTIAAIEERLRAAEGIGDAEVLLRYRSMTRTDEVVLLINVTEHVGVSEKLMFLPIFRWTDEYGVTFGAGIATVDLLGLDERLSFPLTWGGERRAAVEAGFDLDAVPVSRLDTGFEIRQNENPHFEVADRRYGGWLEATRRWTMFEVGGAVRAEDVSFGGGGGVGPGDSSIGGVAGDVQSSGAGNVAVGDGSMGAGGGGSIGGGGTQIEFGAHAAVDTRQDTRLARNAFYIGGAWDHLTLLDGDQGFNRFTADLRGYKSFIGRSIIAAQAYYRGADGRLPDWERPFLGGAATVRGYDAGEFIGDNIALLATELRVPITPPVPVGLVGLNFFFDSGTVYDHGTSLRKARFVNGVGGGIYLFVAFVGLQVDVAYGLQSEEVHFHFSTGFRF